MIREEKTEWRKIPYAPDYYEASDSGIIRSLEREIQVVKRDGRSYDMKIPAKYLTQRIRPTGKSKGHPVVHTDVIGEIRVCLLVARAFHGAPYVPGDLSAGQRWRIRHRDGDITNVSAENLEWISNVASNQGFKPGSLYDQNLRRLEEMRREPVEDWIKRMWGEDALDNAVYEAA